MLIELCVFLLLAGLGFGFGHAEAAVTTPYPLVFVTQTPVPRDFTTIGAVFGNHKAAMQDAPRGGDLWIRYEDGSLKNLTLAAGLSSEGFQGAGAIAVRDPSPSWDGKKVIFSSVVGAPIKRYQVQTYFWQLYEVTGLGKNETPVITKVPNQPTTFNNVSPIYGIDDRIIFTSDRPRNGEAHLYPQLDEYEEAPVVTGLWSLNPATGDLFMLNHAPSGAFGPTIDSAGRVIFTRWDHLQRDQQADADAAGTGSYGTFNYSDESAGAARLNERTEIFPEPRIGTATLGRLTFNQFFPWQINEDGTEEETLNHVGRQELANYGDQSFLDDKNLTYCCNVASRFNKFRLYNDSMLQIKEDPTRPGLFFGASTPEFGTHAAGQIVTLNGSPAVNPDAMTVTYLTPPATASAVPDDEAAAAEHSGLYREPVPLSDGRLIAVHTAETRKDKNIGSTANPVSRYDFRLKLLTQEGAYYRAGEALTPGIAKNLSWYDPDTLVSYSGNLWELNPVELRPRSKPAPRVAQLPAPETQVFNEEGVDVQQFRSFLKDNNLALMVSRNVTQRDGADRQQPFNLRVAGGASSIPKAGKVYDITHLQFFQADQLRGIGGVDKPRPGRRVLAQVMHSDQGRNADSGLPGATAIAADGSVAAFVPTRRAMSWQLTNGAEPVVRERYWLTFQPGEVRVCASCHGINQKSQTGAAEPQNKPEALRRLLRAWKNSSLILAPDWNLVGNGNQAPLNVASVLGDAGKVASVWKWNAAAGKWAFYSPALADGGAAYAADKGYEFLSSVNGGEGFWVNAKQATTASLPSGQAVPVDYFRNSPTSPLASGWNLIAIGQSQTPRDFNRAVGVAAAAQPEIPLNLHSLWAWDNARSAWYFYAPSLDANGGLSAYLASKGYLDFTAYDKTLGPGLGFWVNRP